ncbi:MAG: TetR/AcrR family transcriptional regulator [Nevskiaceae bacterium]|nr:MAG: TetR/AcrR family transcriptional regulator [Nevskiaceae bacterium]TBR71945.1 MAG: TetR/AcrR family transcriptional regulator [Nevskiaceae bacterium]
MPSPTPHATCEGARQILDAALEAFATHGYSGASMHAIAQQAGVSKANVFHHFASKELLYLAVLRTAAQRWRENLVPIAQSNACFADQLKLLVQRVLDHLVSESAQSRVVLREMLENGALRGRELSEEIFNDNFRIETGVFRRAQANGELRAGVDPILAWAATLAACLFFFQTRDVLRFNPDFPYAEAPERFAQGIRDVLLNGIAAHPDLS